MQDILLLFKSVKSDTEQALTIERFKQSGYLSNMSAQLEWADATAKGKHLLFIRCRMFRLSAVVIDDSIIIQTTKLEEALDVASQIVKLPRGVNFLEIR